MPFLHLSTKVLFQFTQNILFDGLSMAINGAGRLLQTMCLLKDEVVIVVFLC
jgi:hypothetical protein